MTRALQITTADQIPPIGTIERATLDFKREHTTGADELYEHAKDMAAFANHLGGTILIGCADVEDALSAYLPLAAPDAAQARRDYEKAALELCVPRAPVVIEEITYGTGVLVAVNVDAYPDRLIGVRHASTPHVWTFPIRQTTRTIYLSPEQLPMYANPDVRRALVLLSAIPIGETIMLRVLARSGGDDRGTARIVRITEDENALVFASAGPPAGDAQQQISSGHVKPFPITNDVAHPIDRVRTVYRGADARWWVVVELL